MWIHTFSIESCRTTWGHDKTWRQYKDKRKVIYICMSFSLWHEESGVYIYMCFITDVYNYCTHMCLMYGYMFVSSMYTNTHTAIMWNRRFSRASWHIPTSWQRSMPHMTSATTPRSSILRESLRAKTRTYIVESQLKLFDVTFICCTCDSRRKKYWVIGCVLVIVVLIGRVE